MFNFCSNSTKFTKKEYGELIKPLSDKLVRNVIRLCLRPNCNASKRWFREMESTILKALRYEVSSERSVEYLFAALLTSKEELGIDLNLIRAYQIEIEEEYMYGKDYLNVTPEYLLGKFNYLWREVSFLDKNEKNTLEEIDATLINWYKSLDSANLEVGYKYKA